MGSFGGVKSGQALEARKEAERCESQEKFNKAFSRSGGGALLGSVPKQALVLPSTT